MRIKFKRLKNSKRKKLENICKLIDYLQIKKKLQGMKLKHICDFIDYSKLKNSNQKNNNQI